MRLGLADILPAQLQNAPDYSDSAPLFLSSLNYLSGENSYYNPNQASQSVPVTPNPSGGVTMTPSQSICEQIQCGAITQEQAGISLLEACSAAGYVGALSCDDPSCAPYMAAMQSNGMCPSASPTPTPSPTPMPSATTAPMPSITNTASFVAPMTSVTPTGMQQRMPRIVNTTPSTITAACSDTFSQWISDNPLLAVLGLGALAYFILGSKKSKG